MMCVADAVFSSQGESGPAGPSGAAGTRGAPVSVTLEPVSICSKSGMLWLSKKK